MKSNRLRYVYRVDGWVHWLPGGRWSLLRAVLGRPPWQRYYQRNVQGAGTRKGVSRRKAKRSLTPRRFGTG